MERSSKKYDTHDLKVAATFIADDIGLEIILKPAQVIQDVHQGTWGRMPGTGLTRRFKGGRHVCHNKAELEMILASDAFVNGHIRRDPEDPTEFWRQLGIVKERMLPVATGQDTTLKIKFDDLDLTVLKKPEQEVIPLSQVV
jgi:hypothetical protein